MRIKKYEGSTEKEAMLQVKEELGKEALIVSVKKIKPKGLYKIFKKPYVEVTAALDDRKISEDMLDSKKQEKIEMDNNLINDNVSFMELLKEISNVSPKDKDNMIHPTAGKQSSNKEIEKIEELDILQDVNQSAPFIKMVYEQLIENEVAEEYVNQLMIGLAELAYDEKSNIDDVVSIIYKRVIKLLSDIETIRLFEDKAKTVAFIGPTGVGKTTTIAKIASYFTLNLNKKVALITADTYRIAAVEQLRTYANILNIPIKVVCTLDELELAIQSFKDKDLILIDTAGRSHKNKEHKDEISKLINSSEDIEVYLVLSLATKYNDLLKITETYNDICDYKLIFTKLDETTCYGNILNIKLKTEAKLSYVTFGQNVPDDISEVNIHDIAKKTLGGCE